MPLLLVAVFIVVPLVELYVIIQIGGSIGIVPTLLLLLLDSILGSLLLRSQGRSAWVALNRAIAESRVPAKEVLDGVLIIFGGALLLTPGFLTDIVGLLLLIPPTRAIVRGFMRRFVVGRFSAGPRAAMWGYDQVQGREPARRRPRGPEPPQGPGPESPRQAPQGDPMFGDFDWREREAGPRPDDIEGTAHEVGDDEELPPGESDSEGRGTFPDDAAVSAFVSASPTKPPGSPAWRGRSRREGAWSRSRRAQRPGRVGLGRRRRRLGPGQGRRPRGDDRGER